MRAKEAREILISDFLDMVWVKPKKQRLGKELWYLSPLRLGDINPSFKVDLIKNLRFDFGLAKGGNMVDLVCELKNITVKDALLLLENSGLSKTTSYKITSDYKQISINQKMFAGEKEKNCLLVLSVSKISSTALIKYLQDRKIDLKIAEHYLKEITYRPENSLKSFYALGFPSGENFELRSKVFKGVSWMKKDLSLINLENGKSLSIFEGFMDFLAFLSYHNITNFENSVIVLNSTSLKDKALSEIKKYAFSKIYLFLDNDRAGELTKNFFLEQIKNTPVIDKSELYKGFNDFNQMTIESNNHEWLN